MQFPKLFLALSVAGMCTDTFPAKADDNAAQAAARAAVLQELQGANGSTGTNTTISAPPTVAPIPAPVAAPAIPAPAPGVAVPGAASSMANATPSSSDNVNQAAARAEVIQKLQTANGAGGSMPLAVTGQPAIPAPAAAPIAQASTASIPAATVVPPAEVSAPEAGQYEPITAPALPISEDQQTRLHALDAKYFANQISPLDYFTQREGILNGQ